jgi:hypothetical protein
MLARIKRRMVALVLAAPPALLALPGGASADVRERASVCTGITSNFELRVPLSR